MNISIFGLGYVGCVSAGCLASKGHSIIGVDTNEDKVLSINDGRPTIIEKDLDDLISNGVINGNLSATTDYLDAVLKSTISFVSVGTPSSITGDLNLDYVYKVIEQIGEGIKQKKRKHIIAIRSTTLPGTCEKLEKILEQIIGNSKHFSLVSNPEFLREGSAVKDYLNPPLTIIGTECEYAKEIMNNLYKDFPAKIYMPGLDESEILKYVNNSFHALKISFANEIGNICQKLNINSINVMKLLTFDTSLNISPYYLKPGFSYGGSCLPKDLLGLQTIAKNNNLETPLLNSINKTNDIQKNRLIKLIYKIKKKNIGVLGLAFKSGTDDLRNSPILFVIEKLLKQDCKVMIYDENVTMSKLIGGNRSYIETFYPQISNLLIDSIETLFNENDIVIINSDYNKIDEALLEHDGLSIIDLIPPEKVIIESDRYFGINW